MENNLKVSKSRPWLICVICCFIFLFSNGVVSSSFNTTMAYIKDEFQLTASQASLVTSMRSLTASFCLAFLLLGYKGKIGLKPIVLVALVSATAAWIVFAYATDFRMLIVGSLLLGICFGFAGGSVITPIIRNWFMEHRAFALGIVTASTGLANIIFPQFIKYIVANYSLKVNFFCIAGMFVVLIIVAAVFLHDDPVKVGCYPLGGEKAVSGETGGKVEFKENLEYAPDWRCQALMMVFIFCLSMFNYSAWANFTLLFTGCGWEKPQVANLMSMCGFFLMITKSGYGFISDKFSVRKSGWVFFLACFISMILCGIFAGVKNVALITVIFMIYCVGGIFSGVSLGVYAMEFSTRKTTKYLSAVYYLMFNVFNLITVNIMGAVAEHNNGDYRPAYLLCAALTVVGFLCVTFAYKLSMDNRKKLDASAGVS